MLIRIVTEGNEYEDAYRLESFLYHFIYLLNTDILSWYVYARKVFSWYASAKILLPN